MKIPNVEAEYRHGDESLDDAALLHVEAHGDEVMVAVYVGGDADDPSVHLYLEPDQAAELIGLVAKALSSLT
jgi:hypothetical protein